MCTHAAKANYEGSDNVQDLEALLSEAREVRVKVSKDDVCSMRCSYGVIK